jgi:hypothetical protein
MPDQSQDTLKDGTPARLSLVSATSTGSIPRRRGSVASLEAIVDANIKGLQSDYGKKQARLRKRVIDECTQWRDSHYNGVDRKQAQEYMTRMCDTLAETDDPWNYDIKDGSLFKERPDHPDMTPINIIHQLGQYLSRQEGHETLPTREQAVKDTEAAGTRFSVLFRAFHYADEDRRIELEKQRKESRNSANGK